MQEKKSFDYSYLIIFFGSLFIFSFLLGNVHLFDWDEANFAEAAREMLLTGNWMQVQIDYHPFWEKPPLFIWLQALSMAVFGINEFAARFPNALIGAATLCALYFVGKAVSTRRVARIWVLVYAGSWLPHFYFKTGIIDPLFNLFVFLAVFQFWKSIAVNHVRNYLWSGMFLGLAVLTKGPAALLICGLCLLVFFIVYKGYQKIKIVNLLLLALTSFVTIFIWFGIDIIQNGWWFTQTFIEYQYRLLTTQDAGHGGPFFYHPLVLLAGCFPASVFLFQYTWNKEQRAKELIGFRSGFGMWMQLLFWVTLILFSIVKTKIIHYSSLCYFPLTFFAAREIYLYYDQGKKLKPVTKTLFLVIGLLLSLSILLLPVVGKHLNWIKDFIQDPFAVANLNAQVSWSYAEMIFGGVLLLVLSISSWMIFRNNAKGIFVLMIVNIVLIEGTMIHFAPKIEEYSQGAAIRFFKSIDEQNQAIYPGVYKSYAYLFYSGKQPEPEGTPKVTAPNIIRGEVDKTLFFVTRNIHHQELLSYYPHLKLVKDENGYQLFQYRSASDTTYKMQSSE